MRKVFFTIWLILIAPVLMGAVRLPDIFSDNMILQGNREIRIWGWGDPGERITVSFNGQVRKVRTAKNGEWMVTLNPEKYGGPHILSIKGKNQVIELHDILIGDVWFCSGQSNMVWNVAKSNNAEEEIAAAQYPEIRSFNVGRKVAFEPVTEISGEWQVCTPETVGNFSAVAYFFARKLFQETNIPIGIINASWGGSEIEPWISEESFASLPYELRDHYNYTPESSPDSMKIKLSTGMIEAGKVQPNSYPSVLYNGMVSPVVNMPIKGVIWYQGENNAHAGRSGDYYSLFPALIRNWRAQWGYEFPFYWVQIANYKPESPLPVESQWAELRDAQHHTLSVPNTGEAVTIDIGEANDIHPRNKQDVGLRLALIALNKTYGQEVVYSGPVFQSMNITGNRIILDFHHTGSGLMVKNKYGYLNGFAIAGADKKYVWAKAYVNKENQVVVYNDEIANPIFVRYAWGDNPGDANLYNREGLPASPFQAAHE